MSRAAIERYTRNKADRYILGDGSRPDAADRHGWRPISTAPKGAAIPMAAPARGNRIEAIYLLGFVPEFATAKSPSMGIIVIWWEPLGGPERKGAWYSDSGENIAPSHWQSLPGSPEVAA